MTDEPAQTPHAADAANAFEELRREISLQRSAIEGLTAAKDRPRCKRRAATRAMEQQSALSWRASINGDEKE